MCQHSYAPQSATKSQAAKQGRTGPQTIAATRGHFTASLQNRFTLYHEVWLVTRLSRLFAIHGKPWYIPHVRWDVYRSSSFAFIRLWIMLSQGYFTSKIEKAIGWARKYSLFQYPFVTACCGMEYMATAASHYDLDRFGAGFPRFSPRQADVLFVVGTINHKMAPVLKTIYDQMCEPKWVIAFGVCTCTGGFYDNYATVQGIDTIIPVDIYIPGCPPRPETVLDGLMKLQEKIQHSRQEF